MEGALLEMLKRQTHLEARLRDQEGQSRRENIRIHDVYKGAEENSASVISFPLKENLELPPSSELSIKRAH